VNCKCRFHMPLLPSPQCLGEIIAVKFIRFSFVNVSSSLRQNLCNLIFACIGNVSQNEHQME
jgi:hypothetical protein